MANFCLIFMILTLFAVKPIESMGKKYDMLPDHIEGESSKEIKIYFISLQAETLIAITTNNIVQNAGAVKHLDKSSPNGIKLRELCRPNSKSEDFYFHHVRVQIDGLYENSIYFDKKGTCLFQDSSYSLPTQNSSELRSIFLDLFKNDFRNLVPSDDLLWSDLPPKNGTH